MSSMFSPRTPLMLGLILTLSACAEGQMPGFLQGKSDGAAPAATRPAAKTTERDVEAPEIFSAGENGLWDGRPSLGGVWVAHPDVKEPERAIIRNTANGQFVIGALFRKERSMPGPRLQVSSDAAAALGMLAGAPTPLDVVALRREEVTDTGEAMPVDMPPPSPESLNAAPEVSETALDPVVNGASKALEAAPAAVAAAPAPAAPAPKPAAKPTSSLTKPYIQIGIFSVEQNAENTAVAMRQAGLIPTIKPGTSSGKPFWRVVVGPAQTKSERASLLKTIKSTGFEDAYPVTD